MYSPLADDPLDTCVGPAAAPENLSTPARFCIVPQQDLGPCTDPAPTEYQGYHPAPDVRTKTKIKKTGWKKGY